MSRSSVLRKASRLEGAGHYTEAIRLLTESAEQSDDAAVLEQLVRLRREAFATVPQDAGRPDWPPAYDDRFGLGGSPPEVDAEKLDAAALGAVVHHGSLVVRGLLGPDRVAELTEVFERTFETPGGHDGTGDGWYAPVMGEPGSGTGVRRVWVREAGGIWIADAPRALFTILRAFEEIRLPEILTDYFGERPVFTVEKSTLRLATPDATPEWHQDGAFMGPSLRTLNTWIALTPCGGDAEVPGIDIVPRCFDDFVETGTRGARLPNFVGPEIIEELAVDCPIVRPRFEPGDALIFDDHSLHATGVSPGMTGNRMAIEFWFFAPTEPPETYMPMVL